MKKLYSKPAIVFEDFTLCTNIAAGCEVTTNAVQNVCAYEVGRGSFAKAVFTTAISGCDYTEVVVEDDGSPSYNGICYHVPTESNNLFTS